MQFKHSSQKVVNDRGWARDTADVIAQSIQVPACRRDAGLCQNKASAYLEVGIPLAVTALTEGMVCCCTLLLLLRVYDHLLLELLVRCSLLLQELLPLFSVWRQVIQETLHAFVILMALLHIGLRKPGMNYLVAPGLRSCHYSHCGGSISLAWSAILREIRAIFVTVMGNMQQGDTADGCCWHLPGGGSKTFLLRNAMEG